MRSKGKPRGLGFKSRYSSIERKKKPEGVGQIPIRIVRKGKKDPRRLVFAGATVVRWDRSRLDRCVFVTMKTLKQHRRVSRVQNAAA
jgi:hypothetical protein